ncbi:MAG: RHS repeat-associated core domain-containing protein, partial [Planctomycetota bacterium]
MDHLFGFTGRDADESTGMHYYRDSWMDPVAGVFLSEDPIGFDGGDVNLTSYVGNSPHDYTDPTGNSWLSKAFKKVKREIRRVISQVREVVDEAIDDIGDFLEEAWDDTRDFVEDHPILSAGIALATGTWFVHAAGGFAGAAAKLGSLASKAVGSISTGFTPASSGIGGTFSLKVGSFASVNVGAGISGTSAFASANVSVLGLPVAGIGKSVGALGKTADPFASTLVGNFSDSLLQNTLSPNLVTFQLPKDFVGGGLQTHSLLGGRATGSIDVGSFIQGVGKNTANDYVNGQFAATGIPTALGAIQQGLNTYHDVTGAIRDVFAPPSPPTLAYDPTKLTPVDGPVELRDPTEPTQIGRYVGGIQPAINFASTAGATSNVQLAGWGFTDYVKVGGAGVWGAVKGTGQGGLNIINSFTDLGADLGNAVTSIPNGVANGIYYAAGVEESQRLYIGKIPKGDWARDVIVVQDEFSFQASKISGGVSAQILTGIGVARLAQAPGAIGKVAQGLEALDTIEGLSSAAQGAYDASQNGLDWQNGSQIIFGGASLSGTYADDLSDAAKRYEITYDRNTFSSGPLPLGGLGVKQVDAPSQGQFRGGSHASMSGRHTR